MSQVSRPLPPSVYWRRRLVVLGGLLVIIVVVSLIIVGPGFGQGGATEAPPTEVVEVEEPPDCMPGQLELTARTDKLRYAAGEQPQLWFTVKNISTTECTLSAGTDIQRYVITSGPDQIWASDDCQTMRTPYRTPLKPGEEDGNPPIPWDRTRSTPETCDSPSRPQAKAAGASYHLRVYLGNAESAETRQFLLD